jgi:hypothetical protein
MVAFGRSIGGQGIGKSNVALTVIVFGVVIGLFFIPEIIGFQRKKSVEYSEPAEVVVAETEPMASLGPDSTSAIETVTRSVESPLLTISRLLEQPKAAIEGPTASESEQELVARCVAQLSETPERKVEKALSGSPLTFEKIKSPEAIALFDRARNDALTLASSLPKKNDSTRYALFSYASALSAVSFNPGQFGEAADAISFIESLDSAVTRAMFAEGIDRTDFLRWSAISLGEELKVSRSARLKNQYNMPFNPRLALTTVWISHPGDLYGRYKESNPAYIRLEGFVVGKDAQRVEIWSNGKQVGTYILGEPDPVTKRRNWNYGQGDGKTPYLIRVVGQNGEVFERNYNFYPKARVLPWVSTSGLYAIPYNMVENKVNRQLDTYFRAGGASAAGNNFVGRF